MKYILKLISFVIVSTLVSCNSNETDLSVINIDEIIPSNNLDYITVTKSQFESSNMQLGKMSQQQFSEVIKTNGEIGVPPESQAFVSAYFEGYVKTLSLIEGQKVKKGQTLFTLENPDYIEIQKNFLEFKNKLEYLKLDFERQKELVKDNVVSQKTFLKAKTDYEIALVNFEALKKKLKLMNINPTNLSSSNLKSIINVASPVSGYITKVNISKGMFLTPSSIAVKIVNMEHIHIELNIYEQDLSKVSIGQMVNFKLQNNNTIYGAKVHLINKVIDKETRLINIHCHLNDKSETNLFTPGMYIEAEVLTKSKLGNSLLESAVVNIEDSYYALALVKEKNNEYTFEKVELNIGAIQNNFVEVLNQEKVVKSLTFLTQGAFNLITE